MESEMIDVHCKVGEKLRIGDQGLIQVVSIEGNCVLLRVTAREHLNPSPNEESRGEGDDHEFRHSE
jgi:hypothetical protein